MSGVQEFDYSVDVLRALLWQYEEWPDLQALLSAKQEWFTENQTAFWSNWYTDVFNLKTANEFGCSVWGVILGVSLSIGQPGTGARPVWGFGAFNQNFNHGNFGRDSAGVAGLSLEQKRLVLRLRYWQLTSDGSAPYANRALQDVFGTGYVLDHGDMTISYVFPDAITSELRQILTEFDLLPRPAGVQVNILINPRNDFGFAPFYNNFNHGAFGA